MMTAHRVTTHAFVAGQLVGCHRCDLMKTLDSRVVVLPSRSQVAMTLHQIEPGLNVECLGAHSVDAAVAAVPFADAPVDASEPQQLRWLPRETASLAIF